MPDKKTSTAKRNCDGHPALSAPIGSAIAAGVWVVCLNASMNPSTWGCVSWCNGNVAHVCYGKDAAIWQSNTWETEYLRTCESEDAARKVVADYEASIEYDPR
jgi:hypothetical protein